MELDPQVWGTVFPELLEGQEPIGTRPILGFRINQIIRDTGDPFGLRLRGLVPRPYFWEPGRNVATCATSFSPHQPPGPACGCGLYACHDFMEFAGGTLPVGFASRGIVLAGVAGTGIVRIHERGWRAQFARIVAFSDEIPVLATRRFSRRTEISGERVVGPAVARVLLEKYQVPIVPLRELPKAMRAAGDFVEGPQ